MDSLNSASEAPQGSFTQAQIIRASGCRRVTLDMRAWLDQADSFKGLPRNTAKPLTFLFAFQGAEPYLGLPPHAFKLVSWLLGLTDPQDWEECSRPIASPSAARQAEFLGGLSPQRVKMLNRALQEAGIFVMRDHPQGRRFCRRDEHGRIVEAYGFDLSLLALRYDEFVRIAAAAKLERERMRKLRRKATLYRRAVHQAAAEIVALGHDSEQLRRLLQETAELVKAARACERSDELAVAVNALQRRKEEAEQLLRELIKPVQTDPKGQENLPHNTSTTLPTNYINNTVIASEESSGSKAGPVPSDNGQSKRDHLFPEALHLTPIQLVELAPQLEPYMPRRFDDYSWTAIFEAASALSADMGISRALWARAWHEMGREYAAVALAVVSTKDEKHFTSGPAGYFAGMLKKYLKDPDELCLGRTLWKLRDQKWGKEGIKERQAMEKAERRRTTIRSRAYSTISPVAAELQRQSVAAPPLPPPASPKPAPALPRSAKPQSEKTFWTALPAMLDEAHQIGLRRQQLLQQRNGANEHDSAMPANSDGGTPDLVPPDRDKR